MTDAKNMTGWTYDTVFKKVAIFTTVGKDNYLVKQNQSCLSESYLNILEMYIKIASYFHVFYCRAIGNFLMF